MYIKYTMGSFGTLPGIVGNTLTIVDDIFTQLVRNSRNSSEITVSDFGFHSITRTRVETKTVTIVDTVNLVLGRSRASQDTVEISDSGTFLIIIPKFGNDSVNIIENVNTVIYDTRGKSKDTLNIEEAPSTSRNIGRSSLNEVSISESVTAFFAGFVKEYINETLHIEDSACIDIFAPTLVSVEAPLTIEDSSFVLITQNLFTVDDVTIVEAVSKVVNTTPLSKSISHTVDLVETSFTKIKQYKTGSGALIYLHHTSIQNNFTNVQLTSLYTDNIAYRGDWQLPPETTYDSIVSTLKSTKLILDFSPVYVERDSLNTHQLQTLPIDGKLDYGFIKYTTDKDFTIISGDPENMVVTDIIIPHYFGVTVSGIEVGSTLVAGQYVEFVVTAHDNVGRAEVSGFFTIHFGNGQIVKIWVALTRQLVYDLFLAPDRGAYTESISYDTKVFTSISNVRKTAPKMDRYKYSCKYTATATSTTKHRAFLNIFRKALWVPVIHPLWGQATKVTAFISDGAVINCVTDGCDFHIGDQVFIFKGPDSYHKAFVLAIHPLNIVIDRKLTTDTDQLVMPSFQGVAKGTIGTSYTVESYAKLSIEVEEFYPYE